jgi:hypothetical protein
MLKTTGEKSRIRICFKMSRMRNTGPLCRCCIASVFNFEKFHSPYTSSSVMNHYLLSLLSAFLPLVILLHYGSQCCAYTTTSFFEQVILIGRKECRGAYYVQQKRRHVV